MKITDVRGGSGQLSRTSGRHPTDGAIRGEKRTKSPTRCRAIRTSSSTAVYGCPKPGSRSGARSRSRMVLGDLGLTDYGRPVAALIDDHLAPNLMGEDGLAIERLADMMFRMTKVYGSVGLASYAVSAVDLALWDAKAKLLGLPVYSLLGGPQKDKLFCYVTGNDTDWYEELGFKAYKLACPYGPADGLEGLEKNEAFVARVREQIGDELRTHARLLDGLRCRVHGAAWPNACAPIASSGWKNACSPKTSTPTSICAAACLGKRSPRANTGTRTFLFSGRLRHDVVDILQPDINWCGGLTTCLKITAAAEASGKSVILHGGGRNPYGQHFSYAMSAVPWLEYFIGSPRQACR